MGSGHEGGECRGGHLRNLAEQLEIVDAVLQPQGADFEVPDEEAERVPAGSVELLREDHPEQVRLVEVHVEVAAQLGGGEVQDLEFDSRIAVILVPVVVMDAVVEFLESTPGRLEPLESAMVQDRVDLATDGFVDVRDQAARDPAPRLGLPTMRSPFRGRARLTWA